MNNIDIFAAFAFISSIAGIVTAIVGLVNAFVKDTRKSIFITLIVVPIITVFSKSIIVISANSLKLVHLIVGVISTISLTMIIVGEFCCGDFDDVYKRNTYKKIRFSCIVIAVPFVAYALNIMTSFLSRYLGDTASYIDYLAATKINLETFSYMFSNMKLTAYYILKCTEVIVISSFSVKGLLSVRQILDNSTPTWLRKEHINSSTVLIGFSFLLLSSTNLIVLILNGIASQF